MGSTFLGCLVHLMLLFRRLAAVLAAAGGDGKNSMAAVASSLTVLSGSAPTFS